jgi:hypothetical protein
MRQVIYTMHFRGQASRSTDSDGSLKTTSSGTSCTLETVVGPAGVETTLHPAPGDLAFLEAELRLSASHTFEGQGVIAFGEESENTLQFTSAHAGQLGPSASAGLMAGTVSWKVTGGTGSFKSATGFITSTFTLTDSGDLSDYHCGWIFVPE